MQSLYLRSQMQLTPLKVLIGSELWRRQPPCLGSFQSTEMSLPVDLQKTGTLHLMFVFKMRDCEGNWLCCTHRYVERNVVLFIGTYTKKYVLFSCDVLSENGAKYKYYRPLSPEGDLNSDINSCPLGQERILSYPRTNTHWASHIWAPHIHLHAYRL